MILRTNYQFPTPFLIRGPRFGGFPASYFNAVPRALIATPFIPFFGFNWPQSINSSRPFKQENKSLQAAKEQKGNGSSENKPNKRKQTKPEKSPELNDPGFRGVTFTMGLDVGNNPEPNLIFRRVYRGLTPSPKRRVRGRPRRRHSSFDYDSKQCASCGTAKTPLWRDAEDGTPLCNACGIRYKKYRIRCTTCWRIPRKDRKSRISCCCSLSR